MLILSQDKSFILNYDNIESIEIGNFEENRGRGIIYARLTSDYFYTIGEYNTIERAKEVLQEIIKYYNLLKKDSVYAMGDSGFIFEEKFYYEMPKE